MARTVDTRRVHDVLQGATHDAHAPDDSFVHLATLKRLGHDAIYGVPIDFDTAWEALHVPDPSLARWVVEHCAEPLCCETVGECAAANEADDVDYLRGLVDRGLAEIGPDTTEILHNALECHNMNVLEYLIFEARIHVTPYIYQHLFAPRYDVEMIAKLHGAGLPWPTDPTLVEEMLGETRTIYAGTPDPQDRQAAREYLRMHPMTPGAAGDQNTPYRLGDDGRFHLDA